MLVKHYFPLCYKPDDIRNERISSSCLVKEKRSKRKAKRHILCNAVSRVVGGSQQIVVFHII